MRKLSIPIVSLAFLLMLGCNTTQRRITYNTFASIGHSVNETYKGYMDLVVSGNIRTNEVPRIGSMYNEFQLAYGAALSVAQFNTNAVAPPDIGTKATAIISAISSEKGGVK